MHPGYLVASVAEEALLQRQTGRYLLGGLCLFGVSRLLFRLALVAAS